MTVLMLLLPILVAALITVAVHVRLGRSKAAWPHTTQGDAVLTHQSYADAGGVADRYCMKRHHSKAYDTAQNVEAKARDWIHAESTTNFLLPGHRSRLYGRQCGLSSTT